MLKTITSDSPNYYRTEIYSADRKEYENIFGKFTQYAKEKTADNIVDFLSAITSEKHLIKEFRAFKEKYFELFQNLISRINNLDESELSAKNIAVIVDAFVRLGLQKDDLQMENIFHLTNKKIRNFIDEDLNKTLSSFTKLGYDKNEVGSDAQTLFDCARGNGFLNINLLHDFSQLGHEAKEVIKANKLASQIHNAGNNAGMLAKMVHSLAKAKFFPELFKNKTQINEILTPEKIEELHPESAFSMVQAQMFCEVFYKKSLIEEEKIASLKEVCKHKQTGHISQMQEDVARLNLATLSEVFHEFSLYSVAGIRDVDLFFQNAEKTKAVFIEIDGPTHFYQDGITKNCNTKLRDSINKELAGKYALKYWQQEVRYLTIGFRDVANLTSELLEKMIEDVEIIKANEQKLFSKFIELNVEDVVEKNAILHSAVIKGDQDLFRDMVAREADLYDRSLLEFTMSQGAAANPIILEILLNHALADNNLKPESINENFAKLLPEPNYELAAIYAKFATEIPQGTIVDAVARNSLSLVRAITANENFDPQKQDAKDAIKLASALMCDVKIYDILSNAKIGLEGLQQEFLDCLIDRLFMEGCFKAICRIIAERGIEGLSVTKPNGLLRNAVANNKNEIVELLIERGVDVKVTWQTSPIHIAADLGNEQIIDMLIKAGADVDIYSNNLSPMFCAIEGDHLEAVKSLSRATKDIDAPVILDGVNPLNMALMKGRFEIAKHLIKVRKEAGKDVD